MADTTTGGPAQRLSLAAPEVRALVVGTGSHVPGSVLPDIPAVAATARDLGAALVQRCGVPAGQVRVIIDPDSPGDLAQALHESAAQATDVLVFAYIGHGLGVPSGELYLAGHGTADLGAELTYQALAFSTVRDILADCRARSIVVILDCCYAGLAQGALGDVTGDVFAAAQVQGSYLLTAAAYNTVALAPAGDRHTAFSGALIDLLEQGDPAGPPVLGLDHAFRQIERTLLARQLPRPWRHVLGSGELLLAPNPAYTAPDRPPPPALRPGDDLSGCPYRGLSAYQPEDARYFFGRQELTAALAGRLAGHAWQHGPLLVLGASGAGKSSLLGAGLVPALHDGRVPLAGSWSWRVVLTTPGDRPLEMLAARLERPDGGGATGSAANGSSATSGAATSGATQTRTLLIVDQFEELFTQTADAQQRAEFVRALGRLCRPPADGGGLPEVLVVIGMRADFYQDATTVPELAAALEQGPVVVGPMTTGQVRRAIEGPAEAAGLVLEAGLTDRLLLDLGAGGGPADPVGSLPLLSHALMSTWRARSGRALTLAGYQASGGIAHAVDQSAEAVYGGLDAEGQRVARRVLLALVRISDDAEDTRGRVPLPDVIDSAGPDAAPVARQVIDALVRARLVDVGQAGRSPGPAGKRPEDEDGPEPGDRPDAIPGTAEISHEALLRAWPRLRDWIRADRAWLLARQALTEAARAWAREGRDPSGLYQGTRLGVAQAALGDRRAELSAAETEFLDASTGRQDADRRARRRRSRVLRGLSASLALLLVVVAGVTVVVVQARDNSRKLSRDTVSQQLAALSTTALTGFGSLPYDADLRALAAWRAAPTPQARSALLSAQLTSFAGVLPASGPAGVAVSLAATRGGQLVAAGYTECSVRQEPDCGRLRIWDAASRRQVVDQAYPGQVDSVAFSPDGALLAVTTLATPFQVQVWDTKTLRPAFTLGTGGGNVIAFSPDGSMIAVAGLSDVVVWDVARRSVLFTVPTGSLTNSLAFGSRGHLLAAGEQTGAVRLWDAGTGRLVKVLTAAAVANGVRAVAFSPDGGTLATASGAGTVRTWRVPGFAPAATLEPGEYSDFDALAFSADGSQLVAGGSSSAIDVWDLATGNLASEQPWDGGSNVSAIAAARDLTFSSYYNGDVVVQSSAAVAAYSPQDMFGAAVDPRAPLVAAGDAAGVIRLWNSRTGRLVRTLQSGALAGAVAFAPDGRSLAASGPGQIRVWDPATGRLERTLPLPRGLPRVIDQLGYSANGAFLVAYLGPVVSGRQGSKLAAESIEVWSTRTGRPTLVIPDSSSLLDTAAFAVAPAGAGMAVFDGSDFELWNLATGRLTARWPDVGARPEFLVVVPGGHTLLAGNDDGTLTEWSLTSHRRIATLLGAPSSVHALAVSPDGRLVAVSGQDPAISLYALPSGSPVATLQRDRDRLNALAFSRDGTHLLSTSDDGFALWWNLRPGPAVRALCQAVRGPRLAASWRALAAEAHASIGPVPC